MLKKTLFTLLFSLFSVTAWSDSCEILLSGPMFQLSNELALGNVNVYNFDKIEMKNVIFTRWVYLSPYHSDDEHTSIGLNSEGELYVLHSDARLAFGGSRAWLLSGKLNIKEFSITGTGLLSATDDKGKVYTIDNYFAERALIDINYLSLTEFLFGKTWPDEGFLRQLEVPSTLERLRTDVFFEFEDDY